MKVRHKTLGVELDVRPFRDSVHIADHRYYETTGGSFIDHADTEWEAIRPEVWRDVTEQFVAAPRGFVGGSFAIKDAGGYTALDINGYDYQGYRLRKIQLSGSPVEKDNRGILVCDMSKGHWAFIIEKREP